jgi:hypothetical protein
MLRSAGRDLLASPGGHGLDIHIEFRGTGPSVNIYVHSRLQRGPGQLPDGGVYALFAHALLGHGFRRPPPTALLSPA